MRRLRGLAVLVTLLGAVGARAQSDRTDIFTGDDYWTNPKPDSAAADSADAFTEYLQGLSSRTEQEFLLQELSISDAEVDSLVRMYELTGEAPTVPGAEPRWDLRLELGALRFNRVEGVNLIPGAELRVPTPRPLAAFGRLGYGWSSEELTWRGGVRAGLSRDPGAPVLELTHARDVYAYGSGGVPGNSITAVSAGKDWDDYFLAEGWSVHVSLDRGPVGVGLGYRTEDQESLANATDFTLFEGERAFRPNPAIDDGEARLVEIDVRGGDPDRSRLAGTLHAVVGGRALGGDFDWESWRAEVVGRKGLWFGDLATLRLSGGVVTGGAPYQGLHLLGGFATLRGYDVNEFPARRFAHARFDYKLGTDLLQWVPFVRRLRLQPVPFCDGAALFRMQTRDGTVVRLDDPEFRFSAGVGIQQNLFGIPGGSGQLRLDVARRLDRGDDVMTYRFGFSVQR